ncbi:MAG: tRNA guanosine(34) transglycosylase Tgt [Oscillospiraceae bacterium]|jgi:queuine tRNA-ribosyltransferase|nr:tRNA guanosine(34) transglycosylase Tgt [Oscillospiraceae bacterium]
MTFNITKTDKAARRGVISTAHGEIQTPCFMNVATQAAIKGGLSAADLDSIGCQIALANTYHLFLRPGAEIVRGQGGLHGFMKWNKPILTDSGGFQVYSLGRLRKITEEGVAFNSHIDGRRVTLTPEVSIQTQIALGSDIIMAFDECIALPAPYKYVEESAERTTRWLERCIAEHADSVTSSALFGINQGGTYREIRLKHMRDIAALDLPGYAIGGLAVGESTTEMYSALDYIVPAMPPEKPRYLMGVGTPYNIIEAVRRGVDMFDCVLPARNGRHGKFYTQSGVLNIKNEKYATDGRVIDSECDCPVCKGGYSRSYIRHLFKSGEILGLRFAVLHNLRHYNRLTEDIRKAIEAEALEKFAEEYYARTT